MSRTPLPADSDDGAEAACWNRIGVTGDRSCPRLEQHVHCRNCPVFSDAAARFLDRALSFEQVAEWTRLVARAAAMPERESESIVIFRIGTEWLGIRTRFLFEVASPRTVHGLPNRRSAVLRGVVNLHGALVVCMSLERLLGIDPAVQPKSDLGQLVHPRVIVLQQARWRVAVNADEVYAVHRYPPREVRPLPSTVQGTAAPYTRGVLHHLDRAVGLLDEAALFEAFGRHLA
jgi:chemotaxis-related protein WspD